MPEPLSDRLRHGSRISAALPLVRDDTEYEDYFPSAAAVAFAPFWNRLSR